MHETHYACREQVQQFGGHVECCFCTGHYCKPEMVILPQTEPKIREGGGLEFNVKFDDTISS